MELETNMAVVTWGSCQNHTEKQQIKQKGVHWEWSISEAFVGPYTDNSWCPDPSPT